MILSHFIYIHLEYSVILSINEYHIISYIYYTSNILNNTQYSSPKTWCHIAPLSSIEAEWALEQPWLTNRHRRALGYAVAPGLRMLVPPLCLLVGEAHEL